MNRETKFRAWNKESKQYVPPMTIQEMIYSTKNEFSLEQLNEWFIFEQYTGLNDNNGVEIYVGDIVEFEGIIGEVQFLPQQNGYAVITCNSDYKLECCKYSVIGNIHENKELLK